MSVYANPERSEINASLADGELALSALIKNCRSNPTVFAIYIPNN